MEKKKESKNKKLDNKILVSLELPVLKGQNANSFHSRASFSANSPNGRKQPCGNRNAHSPADIAVVRSHQPYSQSPPKQSQRNPNEPGK